jgi:hypothetical protein
MGNDISSTRRHFSSRHEDDEATTASVSKIVEDGGGAKLKISDAVGILIDSLCGDGAVEAHRRNRRTAREDSSVLDDGQESYHQGKGDFQSRSSKLEKDRPRQGVVVEEEEVEDGRDAHRSSSSTLPTDSPNKTPTKYCYFSKHPIGITAPHYQGINLTGNTIYMLPAALDIQGCPTICDEDLRKLETKYPNLFRRLPDELLLSSGWRRVSKFCSFSGKPIPDGAPFFHSKPASQHNMYYLLASAIGMTRPTDVEPLTHDLLVLLQTDYPHQCDQAPPQLIQDPNQWVLVDKFCFFSGGPIHTQDEVHYVSKNDNQVIYMLAFLSPNITADELYRLKDPKGHTSVQDVQDVEHIYDLTELDFHELHKYHLGPCRELPEHRLVPKAWTKILPSHFIHAREKALRRALQYELKSKAVAAAVAEQAQDDVVRRDKVEDTRPSSTLEPISDTKELDKVRGLWKPMLHYVVIYSCLLILCRKLLRLATRVPHAIQ